MKKFLIVSLAAAGMVASPAMAKPHKHAEKQEQAPAAPEPQTAPEASATDNQAAPGQTDGSTAAPSMSADAPLAAAPEPPPEAPAQPDDTQPAR
ncbi:MAG: hypothetical protein M0R03_16495 [Novosphingobium sp.]|nr:hypothetical protein [Novosphingobium sp.]